MGKNKQGRLKSVRICPDTPTFSLFTALRFTRHTRLRFNHDRSARHINKMQRPVSDTDGNMFRQGSCWGGVGGGTLRRLTNVT